MKKVLSAMLSVLLLVTLCVPAFAADAAPADLRFSDGKFRILHLCDLQDDYPADVRMVTYVKDMLRLYEPDLVVMGGDNSVAPQERKQDSIKEICDIFVEAKTPFTFVFGNHDNEQNVDKETLLGYYQQYGGSYCLAYDAVPELTGTATHCLPVYSDVEGQEDKVAYNLFMFDSNTYVYDDSGERLGYDGVHDDQINWYKGVATASKAANGGEVVPAISFQHIVMQEVYKALFFPSTKALSWKQLEENNGLIPKAYNINSGLLYEAPCANYHNFGQFDAFLEMGDMRANFTGHDHVNSYSVTYKGIDMVNTPSPTFHSYANEVNRGSRIIDLSLDGSYEDFVVTFNELYLNENSELKNLEGVDKFSAIMGMVGAKLADALVAFFRVIFAPARLIDSVK